MGESQTDQTLFDSLNVVEQTDEATDLTYLTTEESSAFLSLTIEIITPSSVLC